MTRSCSFFDARISATIIEGLVLIRLFNSVDHRNHLPPQPIGQCQGGSAAAVGCGLFAELVEHAVQLGFDRTRVDAQALSDLLDGQALFNQHLGDKSLLGRELQSRTQSLPLAGIKDRRGLALAQGLGPGLGPGLMLGLVPGLPLALELVVPSSDHAVRENFAAGLCRRNRQICRFFVRVGR